MSINNQLFQRLSESESLTDVLIQMEDFLDSMDLYVFQNWIDGEIVGGPDIKRYWVELTLRYPYEQMPDPAGAERLIRHDVKVAYRKEKEEAIREVKDPDDLDDNNVPKIDQVDVWLVDIKIPRRFIEELDDADLEIHVDDQMVDVENVSDARDEDVDATDSVVDDTSGESDEEIEAGDL